MADPVGIIGLTGTVEQLVGLTRDVIYSYKALKENIPAAQSLLATYQELESMLTAVSPESFRDAKTSHVKTVKHELDTVKRIFSKAQEEVESKTIKSGNWASQYVSALKDKARIEELEADADKIRQCIFRLSSDENMNWRLNSVSKTTEEKCCPVIWAEKNLTSVFIDLDAKDENGQPSTCESMLKAAVVGDGRETHVGIVAIGQGGVGKTCTLRAIAHDDDTDKSFPGGVYFLSLGMDATIGTIIQQLCLAVKASGGAELAARLQMEDNIADVVAEVQVWFREEASLFIIDDVWTRNGIDAKVLQSLSALANNVSREDSRRSRILYSTRDLDLQIFGDTITFKPRDHRGDRALEILLRVAGESCTAWKEPECEGHMRAILDKCAGLPLALNVAGSAVRVMRERWKGDARGAWKKYSEMMNEPDRFERQGPDDAYSSLYTMLHSSIKILDDATSKEENQEFGMTFQEMHRALCVLKRQDWLPLSIVQHLWGAVDEVTTERAVKRLEGVGAAELQYHDGNGGVRLHDLTQDFARREAKEYDEEKKWHRKLLDKYRTKDGSIAHTLLWDVNEKEKQYLFENIYRVCQEAGRCGEMYELLQSARWVSSVLQNGTLWVLEQAVKHMTEDITEDMTDQVAVSSEAVAKEKPWLDEDRKIELRKIAKAARLSVPHLNGNVSNLFFQLYARLVEVSSKSSMVKRFLEDVEKWAPKPWLKTIRGGFVSSDEVVEEFHVGLHVAKVKFSSDGITGCGHSYFTSVVSAFTQNRRKGVNVMTWGIDASSDAPLTGELESSSAATADATTTTAEMTARDGEVRVVHDGKLRTLKRLLHRLGATTKCYWWCFRREDDHGPRQEQSTTLTSMDGNEDLMATNPTCLDVSEDLVAAGYSDGRILIGRFSTNKVECTIREHAEEVSSICFSADGSRLVSGSGDKTVRAWEVATGSPVCEALNGHTDLVNCVAMSGDGSRVVSGSHDNTVRVWDVATGAPACETLMGHMDWVMSVAISADGSRVVSGSGDKTVIVWDVATGAPACEALMGHTDWVRSVAMSGDGSRVVSGSDDNTVWVWDAATGAPACEALTGHTDWVRSVAISADGSRVVSGSGDKTVRVWELATGSPACEALTGHTGSETSVAMSEIGSQVVSGSGDKTVHAWDVATGAPACESLTGHTYWVTSVAISADGSRVVSGSSDNMVRVWDVATGAPACETLTGHMDWVTSVAISADGSGVVSGSRGENSVRVWDVTTEYCLLVTGGSKWYETVARYCGCIAEHGEEATSPEEECEHYYFDGKAVKLQRENGNEEVFAQLQPESIWSPELQVDINSRKGVVATGNLNGGVGIFRIIK